MGVSRKWEEGVICRLWRMWSRSLITIGLFLVNSSFALQCYRCSGDPNEGNCTDQKPGVPTTCSGDMRGCLISLTGGGGGEMFTRDCTRSSDFSCQSGQTQQCVCATDLCNKDFETAAPPKGSGLLVSPSLPLLTLLPLISV